MNVMIAGTMSPEEEREIEILCLSTLKKSNSGIFLGSDRIKDSLESLSNDIAKLNKADVVVFQDRYFDDNNASILYETARRYNKRIYLAWQLREGKVHDKV